MLELNNRDEEMNKLHRQFKKNQEEMERHHTSSLQKVEKKLDRAASELDNRTTEIRKLNTAITDLRKEMEKKIEEHQEVDEEADELHTENEELLQKVGMLESANEKLQKKVKDLQTNSTETMGLRIEMQLQKDERDKAIKDLAALKEAQGISQESLTSERDAAKAEVMDLEQRLAAQHADLEVSKADYARALMVSSNLEMAMTAFESEREAELALLEESRASTEEAIKAAHELALEAMTRENERVIQEGQLASNEAVTNMMNELQSMEQKQESIRKENINLRRSLDEAIHHLQNKEEDVIDRSLMKNILLDWYSKSGKAKRDVMSVMSSVLHFTEDEKDKCGLGDSSRTMGKVYDTFAPPLTPAMKNLEDLDGDNIREKWVNFLLAESGDVGGKGRSISEANNSSVNNSENSDGAVHPAPAAVATPKPAQRKRRNRNAMTTAI